MKNFLEFENVIQFPKSCEIKKVKIKIQFYDNKISMDL